MHGVEYGGCSKSLTFWKFIIHGDRLQPTVPAENFPVFPVEKKRFTAPLSPVRIPRLVAYLPRAFFPSQPFSLLSQLIL
jgi:hypothetical protein